MQEQGLLSCNDHFSEGPDHELYTVRGPCGTNTESNLYVSYDREGCLYDSHSWWQRITPPPLARCYVEHGAMRFGRVHLCALYWNGGGSCRVSPGVGILHFESHMAW